MDFVSPKTYTFASEVTAALAAVDQGTILCGVPLVYAANGVHAVLRQTAAALAKSTGGVHLAEIDAMVTSQTCDIRGPGCERKPFLTVAPIYPARYLTNDSAGALRRRNYTVPLTGPFYDGLLHIADLRFETAVEKSVAVGRERRTPFATPGEYADLAKKLGESRRRAAFDPTIEKHVLQPLEELLPSELADQIYEVRVDAEPSIARASSSRLIIACYADADLASLRELLEPWYDSVRETLTELTLRPLLIDRVDRLTLNQVQGSVPVYFGDFSDEPQER